MGRETIRYVDEEREYEESKRMNPLWRGVGCLIIVVLGFVGYFVSGLLMTANIENQWVYIPPSLMWLSFAPWLPPGTLIRIVVGLAAVLLGYSAISVVYAIVFPIVPKETDVPPLKASKRRRR
jgi:hypothetical protein